MKPLFLININDVIIRFSEWPKWQIFKMVNSTLVQLEISFGETLIVLEKIDKKLANEIGLGIEIYIQKERNRIADEKSRRMPTMPFTNT